MSPPYRQVQTRNSLTNKGIRCLLFVVSFCALLFSQSVCEAQSGWAPTSNASTPLHRQTPAFRPQPSLSRYPLQQAWQDRQQRFATPTFSQQPAASSPNPSIVNQPTNNVVEARIRTIDDRLNVAPPRQESVRQTQPNSKTATWFDANQESLEAKTIPGFGTCSLGSLEHWFEWPEETSSLGKGFDFHSSLAGSNRSSHKRDSNRNPFSFASLNSASPVSLKAPSQTNFKLADQPKPGEHYMTHPTVTDPLATVVEYNSMDFHPDPVERAPLYQAADQIDVYSGKTLNANQRPLVEWGRRFYFLGDIPESYTFMGDTNLVNPRFLVYGDYRSAMAYNQQNGSSPAVWAHRLNLDFDLKLTSTERFHAFMGPLDNGAQFSRGVYEDGQFNTFSEFDGDFDTAFFEGDVGAITGGFGDEVIPFDMPFAIGLMPLLFQNGVWMEDAILGVAVTLPAKNSPALDIPNYDVTFFFGFDKINSPAFQGDDAASRLYGFNSFLEAYGGYWELGYVFLEDRTALNRSYSNIGLAYTRRYGRFLSTSYRAIINAGQDPNGIAKTADGAVLLWENSLITSNPYTVVPYFNLFAGFGRPQSVARAGAAGGVLRNTGINFETDGLTGYPTLDATANNTWGGAFGLNLLSSDFDQQLVVEMAFVETLGTDQSRNAPGDQIGFGVRYQIPISNAALIRMDAMYGWLDNSTDITGARIEFRHKF